jgi:hypothetical protein
MAGHLSEIPRDRPETGVLCLPPTVSELSVRHLGSAKKQREAFQHWTVQYRSRILKDKCECAWLHVREDIGPGFWEWCLPAWNMAIWHLCEIKVVFSPEHYLKIQSHKGWESLKTHWWAGWPVLWWLWPHPLLWTLIPKGTNTNSPLHGQKHRTSWCKYSGHARQYFQNKTELDLK